MQPTYRCYKTYTFTQLAITHFSLFDVSTQTVVCVVVQQNNLYKNLFSLIILVISQAQVYPLLLFNKFDFIVSAKFYHFDHFIENCFNCRHLRYYNLY